jgi:hypothetical protein
MRVMTIALIGIFGACVAFPASAQTAAAPTWEECHDQAVKHGWHDAQKGTSEFMRQCRAGKIPGVVRASLSPRLARGSFEECEARAVALAMPHGQAGHVEYVRECMGGRPRNSNIAAGR